MLSQYNATIGLLSDSPGSSLLRNTYWLYSDNYLALLALRKANSSDPLNQASVMQNVSSTLQRYNSTLTDVKNQWMVLTSNVFYFNNSSNYRLTMTRGASINITLNNGTFYLSPSQYADIAFLEALYYQNTGNYGEATSMFEAGANMYNGIGLNDHCYQQTGIYQTYKLALYVAALLGQSYPSSVNTALLAMQNVTNGGFYTGYNSTFGTAGTYENVETTSLAILGLTANKTSSSIASDSSISSQTSGSSVPSTHSSSTTKGGIVTFSSPLIVLLIGVIVVVIIGTFAALIFRRNRT